MKRLPIEREAAESAIRKLCLLREAHRDIVAKAGPPRRSPAAIAAAQAREAAKEEAGHGES